MNVQPLLPQYIDSTMISCFRQCPRRFYYEFILGLRPAHISIDLHAGGCFASALERFYKETFSNSLPLEAAKGRALATFMNEWGDVEPIKDTPKTKERVWDAVEAYVGQWSPHTDTVQPFRKSDGTYSYEYTFSIPLLPEDGFPLHPVTGAPFLYSGRFDMLGLRFGKTVWKDEKTTKSIGADWAEQWDLRSQFIGYTWALQKSGIPCEGGVVRGIGILKTKITLAEAHKVYSNELISRWHEQLRRDLQRLVGMWNENYWDYNLADACSSYGGCAFRLPCSSADPSRWYDGYTIRRWNPTLKNPIAEAQVAA